MDIIARVLTELEELPLNNVAVNRQLIPILEGISSFVLEVVNGNRYVITVVADVDLDEVQQADICYVSNVAGFFNSQYLAEIVKFDAVEIPLGRFVKSIREINSKGRRFNVFVGQLDPYAFYRGPLEVFSARKNEVTLDQVFVVAKHLSNLHAAFIRRDFSNEKATVDENHAPIRDLLDARLSEYIRPFIQATLHDRDFYFSNANSAFERFEALFKAHSRLSHAYPSSSVLPRVPCHGNLTSVDLTFASNDELMLIANWQTVHFGTILDDICHLAYTSLDPGTRRSNIARVLRVYYYTLIDHAASATKSFKLENLMAFYRSYATYAVLSSFPHLAALISSSEYSDAEKRTAVRRWEAAVADAHAFEFGERRASASASIGAGAGVGIRGQR